VGEAGCEGDGREGKGQTLMDMYHRYTLNNRIMASRYSSATMDLSTVQQRLSILYVDNLESRIGTEWNISTTVAMSMPFA
jgi:hypothetical protein